MLDSLRRSYEAVETEERLLDYEETRKRVEASLDGSAFDSAFDSAPDSAAQEEPEPEDAQ
jgi:hypothetical protein